ncbi:MULTISPECIES: hypothetical protein [Rheinheimera]|uniref:MSHA biogenesis protein MshK n=1 Tax=Rheinheimera marina TaxID=1774958 RepID=A0ABV9JJ26_9GAMM
MKVILSFSLLCCSGAALALADPTEPELLLTTVTATAEKTEPVVSELKLNLIRTVKGKPIALINGQTVRQGDAVADWTVLAIEPQRVVLRQGSEQKILQLFKTMKSND